MPFEYIVIGALLLVVGVLTGLLLRRPKAPLGQTDPAMTVVAPLTRAKLQTKELVKQPTPVAATPLPTPEVLRVSVTDSSTQDDPARRRWSERMRTDPLLRRRKLEHWQWQIAYAAERGWPAPPDAVGGISFYGDVHEQWKRQRERENPNGWERENAAIEAKVAKRREEYVSRQAETDARVEQQLKEIEADRRNRPPSGNVTEETGKLVGRHTSTYVEEIKDLLRDDRDAEAEALLLQLLDVIEDESEATGFGVAPWFYERLAMIYSKRRDYASEVEVLERFSHQRHAVGVGPPKLLKRLEKARRKLR